MKKTTIQDLLAAGSHFGHLTRRWNPKMRKYIFMERNGIHILDLSKTLNLLERAQSAIREIAAKGDSILFLGTKKQASEIVKNEAERIGMHFVNSRWLGGTLTNFSTIKKSVKKMKNLEKMATDGTYDKLSKKEILTIERELERYNKMLGGIRNMNRLPGAIFIVDTKKESIAVAEARRLGIPLFGMVDTNCDPDPIDYVVPCNDDAFKSIHLVTHVIADAIVDGQAQFSKAKQEAEAVKAEDANGDLTAGKKMGAGENDKRKKEAGSPVAK